MWISVAEKQLEICNALRSGFRNALPSKIKLRSKIHRLSLLWKPFRTWLVIIDFLIWNFFDLEEYPAWTRDFGEKQHATFGPDNRKQNAGTTSFVSRAFFKVNQMEHFSFVQIRQLKKTTQKSASLCELTYEGVIMSNKCQPMWSSMKFKKTKKLQVFFACREKRWSSLHDDQWWSMVKI